MYRAEWQTELGRLVVEEPTAAEIEAAVPTLVAGYNEPTNAVLLGHTEPLTEDEVRDHYAALLAGPSRAFLLYRDGVVVGDADLRGVEGSSGEFAFLIADPAAQGRGLGTRFALMVHALAFGPLGMARLYAAIVPDNVASRRVFDKLGYVVDNTVEGLEYGDPGDIILVVEHAELLRAQGPRMNEIRIAVRSE